MVCPADVRIQVLEQIEIEYCLAVCGQVDYEVRRQVRNQVIDRIEGLVNQVWSQVEAELYG